MPYTNNKGANQPAHPRSLISALVVHFLDSIIPLVFFIRNFKTVASLCSWADRFVSCLVANPEDRFACDEAQVYGTPWIFPFKSTELCRWLIDWLLFLFYSASAHKRLYRTEMIGTQVVIWRFVVTDCFFCIIPHDVKLYGLKICLPCSPPGIEPNTRTPKRSGFPTYRC